MLTQYDPEHAPDPAQWLDLDEDERKLLVMDFHRDARIPIPKASRVMHAAIHVIVENQLALEDQQTVRDTLQRLLDQGLSRHEAVHAIGSVLAEHMFALLNAKGEPPDISTYYSALEKLVADNR